MLKILLLSDSFNGYGAEHMLKWLGNNLSINHCKVSFCSIFDKERSADISSDADYFQVNIKDRRYNIGYFIKSIRFLVALIKASQYDFVITFHTNPFLISLVARFFCRFKLIHSERDNPYARNTFPARFKAWLYRYADKVVFQTVGAQRYFDKKTVKKSVIIPNPIQIPKFKWRGGINKTLVSVGRLDVIYKRQDLLLNAFYEISSDFPDYKLVFYGDGKDRNLLMKLADDLGISSRVDFFGKVRDVNERLLDEGIFVMTSDSEGMPNALMEAMSIGMPVISTDCEPGGAAALIDNGENGLIVKRSSVAELSAALRKLIVNKDLQAELGKKACVKMENFAPDKIIAQWLKFINC